MELKIGKLGTGIEVKTSNHYIMPEQKHRDALLQFSIAKTY